MRCFFIIELSSPYSTIVIYLYIYHAYIYIYIYIYTYTYNNNILYMYTYTHFLFNGVILAYILNHIVVVSSLLSYVFLRAIAFFSARPIRILNSKREPHLSAYVTRSFSFFVLFPFFSLSLNFATSSID